jgi:diphosphomevalonate decarboxylase
MVNSQPSGVLFMTGQHQAEAIAHPNIALIKYWGNRQANLRLPANSSLSMTLSRLETHVLVHFDESLATDSLTINRMPASPEALRRVSEHLNRIRHLAGIDRRARVASHSNFPSGAGIASSAAAFAALSLAGAAAAGIDASQSEISRLARLGSGSACRSIFGGFVEWPADAGEADSHGIPAFAADYWALADVIAVVRLTSKHVGSTMGHAIAASSPIQDARVADCQRRLTICKKALAERDFNSLADVVELDSNLMHAVMMTSTPSVVYWEPPTLAVMQTIRRLRRDGLPACYTLDAGPNVHCLCLERDSGEVARRLAAVPGVIEILAAGVGGPARLLR